LAGEEDVKSTLGLVSNYFGMTWLNLGCLTVLDFKIAGSAIKLLSKELASLARMDLSYSEPATGATLCCRFILSKVSRNF
jgi:hypothetical protein